jgi:hypothetical protein
MSKTAAASGLPAPGGVSRAVVTKTLAAHGGARRVSRQLSTSLVVDYYIDKYQFNRYT